jgi:tetratricopeptide (TPR) repeat protein
VRRTRLSGRMVFVATLLLSLLYSWSPVRGQERPNPCAVPDALLEVGEKEEARKEYVALVKADPTTRCAIAALKVLNAPVPPSEPMSCREADEEFDQGDLDSARDEYEQLPAGTECAATGLAAIREVDRLCKRGEGYLTLDREDDALASFKSALEKNPEADCATAGLEDVRPSLLDRISAALPDVLWAVGLIVLLVFVVLLTGYFNPMYRFLSTVPVLRHLLRPRLSLQTLDDSALGFKVGAPLTARIKERLRRFRAEALGAETPGTVGTDYDLDFGGVDEEFADLVSGSSSLQNSLGKLSGLSEHTKLVGGLVDLVYALLPIKRLSISGVCDPAAASGASASLTLERDARLLAAVTLTGPPLPKAPTAPDYLALADPAAVWAQYVVARSLTRDDVRPEEAESYALLREGLGYQLAGDDIQARIAYREAIELNAQNWAARVNLAVTEARLAKRFETAVQIIQEAIDEMRGATA